MSAKIVRVPARTSVLSIGADGISSTPMQAEIAIKPPSKEKPGFLRRQQKMMEIQQRLRNNEPAAINDMVRFLLEHADEVHVPEGVDPADAILDLSESDWAAMIQAMSNTGGDPTNGG